MKALGPGGIIKSRDEGIIAGLRFMIPFLKYLGFEVITYKHDSDVIRKGDVIMEIIGDGGGRLLAVERLTLNLLSSFLG
ncbi:hypothetical protein [Vulcanisaeta souniana]|uniref:hypothetical protein n=1 Tax=Vulcanisaeta souniana TaxID=164452 RepID=UPI000ABF6993|nr:hypothetical protein [Vulcanisaeta souniana]